MRKKGQKDCFAYYKKCRNETDFIKLGCLLLLIYPAVFSNMACNIVLI